MFAVTPRLLLRPGWPEDAGALFAAINDEAVVRNLARAPWPYGRNDAAQFLAASRPLLQPNFLIFRRD
ncbi:MAG: GNAT family N-acetyltransferase, partial [Sphingomonadales bacterium]|nr:GNAT family N-acetyltransferase [Sphingomonadales bacterium]